MFVMPSVAVLLSWQAARTSNNTIQDPPCTMASLTPETNPAVSEPVSGKNSPGSNAAIVPGSVEDIEQKTSDFFNSVIDLVKEEASATTGELEYLEKMNALASSEYAEIADSVSSLEAFQEDVAKKQAALASCVEEIESLDQSSLELEKVVGLLDEYTKRIEAKAKPFL